MCFINVFVDQTGKVLIVFHVIFHDIGFIWHYKKLVILLREPYAWSLHNESMSLAGLLSDFFTLGSGLEAWCHTFCLFVWNMGTRMVNNIIWSIHYHRIYFHKLQFKHMINYFQGCYSSNSILETRKNFSQWLAFLFHNDVNKV